MLEYTNINFNININNLILIIILILVYYICIFYVILFVDINNREDLQEKSESQISNKTETTQALVNTNHNLFLK